VLLPEEYVHSSDRQVLRVSCRSCAVLFILYHPKGLFDEGLVTLHRALNSHAVFLTVTIETDFADIFDSRLASVHSLEPFTPLLIVALYFDMVHLGLSKVDVSILENVVPNLDLCITK
jgi:hypothetical protein